MQILEAFVVGHRAGDARAGESEELVDGCETLARQDARDAVVASEEQPLPVGAECGGGQLAVRASHTRAVLSYPPGGDNPLTVRTEIDTEDFGVFGVVAVQLIRFLPRAHVPTVDDALPVEGEERPAVGSEAEKIERVEGGDFSPRFGVVDVDRLCADVVGGDEPAVGTERRRGKRSVANSDEPSTVTASRPPLTSQIRSVRSWLRVAT